MNATRKFGGLLGGGPFVAMRAQKANLPLRANVLGMGVGATDEAVRWAQIGMLVEKMISLRNTSKRPAHRPKIEIYHTLDASRAFQVWQLQKRLRYLSNKPNARYTTRELIQVLAKMERRTIKNSHKRLFIAGDQTIEQLVSRGKKHLGIDQNWHSEFCEEVWRSFQQTT